MPLYHQDPPENGAPDGGSVLFAFLLLCLFAAVLYFALR